MMAIKNSEQEARKLKEEKEARKREDEDKKLEKDLKDSKSTRVIYVSKEPREEEKVSTKVFDVCQTSKEYKNVLYVKDAIPKLKDEEDFEKEVNELTFLNLYKCEYGILGRRVGDKYVKFSKFENLRGKLVFFLTDKDKSQINTMGASSGMSFLDKWFDDENEEKGSGAISVLDKIKDEESGWNKEILLECCDGGSLRKNLDDLLQKSRFFRKMMSFNGKETHEAREDGKIKIEFLSSMELEYYLNVVFGVQEEELFLDDIGGMRLLLRLLEFGVRYQERKLIEKILTDLETVVIPDLVSCGHFELKLLIIGYLLVDGIPNGLLEELLDRWCSLLPIVQTASRIMRYVKYSSNVMEKVHMILEEEGGKDMLDEECVQVDYGVGEVVTGNGEVLEQCFVGEFGGRLMVWNEGGECSSSSSFVGCLKEESLEQTLIKKKRRREEEDSQVGNCVGEGKVRKLMKFDELKSFLMK